MRLTEFIDFITREELPNKNEDTSSHFDYRVYDQEKGQVVIPDNLKKIRRKHRQRIRKNERQST